MNTRNAFILAAAAALFVLACGSTDTSSEPTDNTNEDLKKHCVENVLCVIGDHWDSKLCKCVPDSTGVACGAKHCSAGEYCCSASCGICERIGAMCPAIACRTPL
jgi:hypothetical protein